MNTLVFRILIFSIVYYVLIATRKVKRGGGGVKMGRGREVIYDG